MRFPRVDATVAICKAHLDATATRASELESYLVGYVLVLAYSEFEQRAEAIVQARAGRAMDGHVANFLKAHKRKISGRIKISDLAGTMGWFDDSCKLAFQAAVTNTPQHVAYDNVIANRTLVAHVSGTSMTFAELEAALPLCGGIFDAMCTSLGLTAAEIDTIEAGLVIPPAPPRSRLRTIAHVIGEWLMQWSASQ